MLHGICKHVKAFQLVVSHLQHTFVNFVIECPNFWPGPLDLSRSPGQDRENARHFDGAKLLTWDVQNIVACGILRILKNVLHAVNSGYRYAAFVAACFYLIKGPL